MILRDKYYTLKPFLPRFLRMAMRRWYANRRRPKCQRVWPILESAGTAPQGWTGWPEGKRFALVLTHDVEGQRGLDNCRRLKELEMRHGFRSSFNFIPEGDYLIREEAREDLVVDGFEVGLHDLKHDGRLFDSRALFAAHARKINGYLKEWNVVGFRSAFMLHELEWLHELNILYDASTFDTDPFEPQPDGVHTIFPFCCNGKHPSAYVELPYTLPQDSTLFLLFRERTIDIWERKLDWIAERGGMALVNVHPDYMSFSNRRRGMQYPAEQYEKLLRLIKEKYEGEYWHVLPREMAAYWSGRKHPLARAAEERAGSLYKNLTV